LRKGAVVCLIVGIAIWLIGVGFALWFGATVEGMNPDWEGLPAPDCYIGAQTVVHAIFLPMLMFSIIGSAFVLPGLNALLRS